MQRTLHEHIMTLELRVQELRSHLTKSIDLSSERTRIEEELRLAELALGHYQIGFDIEQKIA